MPDPNKKTGLEEDEMIKTVPSILAVLFLSAFITENSFGAGYGAVDSLEAYNMVSASPKNTFIIDVRSQAEYVFVGHPDLPNGAPNIPLRFWPGWKTNTEFVKKVEGRYGKDDTIITICRSGGRAEEAARLLAGAGFTNVYYMKDSFEGPTDKEGHRSIGGWKVNGLPYTYELDPGLVYK